MRVATSVKFLDCRSFFEAAESSGTVARALRARTGV